MPSPTVTLREALWALDETSHQLGGYNEDNESWAPIEDMLATLNLLRWAVSLEIEETERGAPSTLRRLS